MLLSIMLKLQLLAKVIMLHNKIQDYHIWIKTILFDLKSIARKQTYGYLIYKNIKVTKECIQFYKKCRKCVDLLDTWQFFFLAPHKVGTKSTPPPDIFYNFFTFLIRIHRFLQF